MDTEPLAFAVFAHCFTCTKNLSAISNISRALTQKGVAVLRFDFTGLGDSEGDFSDTNFSSNVDDIIAASEFLTEHYAAPQIFIGHSLGAAAVLLAAGKIDSVKSVATIGAPFDPAHIKHLLKNGIEEINVSGKAIVSIGGRPFEIKKQFLDDLLNLEPEIAIHKLNKALLILHSPQDNTVNIENASQIYKAAKYPKSFISLDNADHLLTNKKDSLYAGEIISTWAKKYIDTSEKESSKAVKGVFVRTGESGFTTEIKAGNHSLLADEPVSAGGNNLGPTPYDLLASALGACTAMTLRMYADRKKIDLKEINVHLHHSKIYADDCAGCDNTSSKIDSIERIIELQGNFTDETKQRLLEIADKCPVHKTLLSKIKINTSLK